MIATDSAQNLILVSVALLLLFFVVLLAVKKIDVQPIGPQKSKIGLAKINNAVKCRTGFNILWYNITEKLGWLAIATAAGFGVVGFVQLVKTKSLFEVDKDIILLGAFYIFVMAVYFFFEKCIVNYRPVLIKDKLEASFPSSHTMVVIFVMVTAMYQFSFRIQNPVLCAGMIGVRGFVAVVTVTGRVLSGAHWFTDIVAGLFLSGSLACLYISLRMII